MPQYRKSIFHRWQNINFYIDDKADTIAYADLFEETLFNDLESAMYICKKHLETKIKVEKK